MKKLFFLLFFCLFLSLKSCDAASSYTLNDVSQHNTPNSCWMVINQNVYDFTSYLSDHDRYLDMRSWCGQDATNDYNTKAGRGKSHSSRADSLLNQYFIGTLDTTVASIAQASTSSSSNSGRYNLFIPLFGTIIAYFLSQKFFTKSVHNFIWNSVILLGLIPSFVFGVIMVLSGHSGYFLYSHVELSIVFGIACIPHFLFRLSAYISQLKISFKL